MSQESPTKKVKCELTPSSPEAEAIFKYFKGQNVWPHAVAWAQQKLNTEKEEYPWKIDKYRLKLTKEWFEPAIKNETLDLNDSLSAYLILILFSMDKANCIGVMQARRGVVPKGNFWADEKAKDEDLKKQMNGKPNLGIPPTYKPSISKWYCALYEQTSKNTLYNTWMSTLMEPTKPAWMFGFPCLIRSNNAFDAAGKCERAANHRCVACKTLVCSYHFEKNERAPKKLFEKCSACYFLIMAQPE